MDRPADVVLTLPMPPSANRLQQTRAYRAKGTGKVMAMRYSTSDYAAWKALAEADVASQSHGDQVAWRYEMRLTIPVGRIDPDNRIKPTSDLLQSCGIIANDKHLMRLVLVVDEARTVDRMLVEIWSLGAAPTKTRKRKMAA